MATSPGHQESGNASSHPNRASAPLMTIGPKKKERTIKGDRCNPAKDLPTIKLVFSLEHMEGK